MIFILLSQFFDTQKSFSIEEYTPQFSDPLFEKWRWRSYPFLTGKGLKDLAETGDGRIWFAVNDGIYAYNGYDWTLFTTDNGLVDGSVSCLYSSRNFGLFVGTDRGVSRFFNEKWEKVFNPQLEGEWDVYDITVDETGAIWLATRYGLVRINGQKIHFFSNERQIRIILDKVNRFYGQNMSKANKIEYRSAPFKIPVNLSGDSLTVTTISQPDLDNLNFDVYNILLDYSNYLWLGLKDGAILRGDFRSFNEDSLYSIRVYGQKDGLSTGNKPRIYVTSDSTIWTVSEGLEGGVNKFIDNKWINFFLSNNGGSNRNLKVAETDDGVVWISGSYALHRYKDDHWSVYTYASRELPIPSQRTRMHISSDGAIWFWGFAQEPVRFEYNLDQWKTLLNLNYQCDTSDGTQWFLSYDGKAIRKSGNEWKAFGVEDGLIKDPVALYSTKKGVIWAIGSHKNVAATAYFKDGKWKREKHPTLSWGIDRRAFLEDNQGRLWFGAAADTITKTGQMGGLLVYEKNKWHHYFSSEIPSAIYGFVQTHDGNIWACGYFGLMVFDGKVWKKQKFEGISKYRSDVITTDSDGFLWAGTRGYGVFHYNGHKWINYQIKDGLDDTRIIDLFHSSDDNFWAVSSTGFNRHDNSINELPFWKSDALPVAIHNPDWTKINESSDGVLWINSFSDAWCQRTKSQLDFEMAKETKFMTTTFKPDKFAPKTKISIYLDKVPQPGNAIISWESVDKWNRTSQDDLEYSYRLDGGIWSHYSKVNEKVFFDLKDGAHKFEVKARDQDFNVEAQPAILTFKVLPPVWKESWFLYLVSVFTFIVLYQSINIIKKNKELLNSNSSLKEANKDIKLSQQKLEKVNYQLELELAQRKKTELALQQSELQYSVTINSLSEAIHVIDKDFNLILYNKKFKDQVKEVGVEVNATHVNLFILLPFLTKEHKNEYEQVFKDKKPVVTIEDMKTVDNKILVGEIFKIPVLKDDIVEQVITVVRDITAQKRHELEIKNSLEEKKLLLKEIHHRVKNNLQIISSLLYLQSKNLESEQDARYFEESRNRVQSMAIIHEKLYQSADFLKINFSEYLKQLAQTVLQTYSQGDKNVQININVEDVFLKIDQAIPCGLLVNELISNALKHAFSDVDKGEITVYLGKKMTDESGMVYILQVQDNGKGGNFEVKIKESKSLGLQLVQSLTRQLDGELNFYHDHGTNVQIIFPFE